VHLGALLLLALLSFRQEVSGERPLVVAAFDTTPALDMVELDSRTGADDDRAGVEGAPPDLRIEPQEPRLSTLALSGATVTPPSALLNGVGPPEYDLLGVAGGGLGSALSGRIGKSRGQMAAKFGGTPASERAVEAALKWLAEHQMADGGWDLNHQLHPHCHGQCGNPGRMARTRIAATGLALLPFLGAGQTHKEGRYQGQVRNGLYYLIRQMKAGPHVGGLNEPGGRMYAHGIATIALCEAYAMTYDKRLAGPAQQAVNFICWAQDPVGGGWRYEPHEAGDTSVVGWQIMALKSARMADLAVAPAVWRKASAFLDSVQENGGATYGYTDPGGGEATTAIGLLCRMHLGWKRDNPALVQGVRWLARLGPSQGNLYYDYYATQVLRHWEGDLWKAWNELMREHLVRTQATQGHEAGSWFMPEGDLGAVPGGRLYCTSMATMILEVYYRHMPIYAKESTKIDFPD